MRMRLTPTRYTIPTRTSDMEYKQGRETTGIFWRRKEITAKYKGLRLVWQKFTSLYNAWFHDQGWSHDRGWFHD